MAWTVSVRDDFELERRLKEGEEIDLPEECKHNNEVIYQILQYADRVLLEFKLLSDKEVRTIADTVTYLMRPDIIISGEMAVIGPNPLVEKTTLRIPNETDERNFKVHLRNNPDELSPEWEIPKNESYLTIGSEFFRVYTAAISWMPRMYDRLDPQNRSLKPAFRLADLTAYLLDPKDITDYRYNDEEIEKFHQTLRKEAEEI